MFIFYFLLGVMTLSVVAGDDRSSEESLKPLWPLASIREIGSKAVSRPQEGMVQVIQTAKDTGDRWSDKGYVTFLSNR